MGIILQSIHPNVSDDVLLSHFDTRVSKKKIHFMYGETISSHICNVGSKKRRKKQKTKKTNYCEFSIRGKSKIK